MSAHSSWGWLELGLSSISPGAAGSALVAAERQLMAVVHCHTFHSLSAWQDGGVFVLILHTVPSRVILPLIYALDNILAFVNLQCCPDGTCEYVLCLSIPVAAEKQSSPTAVVGYRWLLLS